jgi:uncharacterized protein YndB with AHSA1/START domain
MTRITIVRSIAAPVEKVFATVADIRQYASAVKDIVKFEFLSEVRSGVGTRFRETRVMNGKEHRTELDVTEYVRNERVRMVADSHGTVWDTLFDVKAVDGQTVLTTTMDATSRKLLPRIIVPLMSGKIGKAIAKDMDGVKAYCES